MTGFADPNKWKESLLKSSLPLEIIVSEILLKCRMYPFGEYTYNRANENGRQTEFSVDVHAWYSMKRKKGGYWSEFSVLAECKYVHPGNAWVFVPHITDVMTGSVCVLQELTTNDILDASFIHRVESPLPFCQKGVQIHEGGMDPAVVAKGLNQLRYALPHFARQQIVAQINCLHEEDLNIKFILPILVTTAPLRILKTGLSIVDFQNSNSLDGISDEVGALVVHATGSAGFYEYKSSILSELHEAYPQISDRFRQIKDILKNDGSIIGYRREEWAFDLGFRNMGGNIIVVNIEHLENTINKFRNAIYKSSRSKRRFAKLRRNIANMKTWFVPVTDEERDGVITYDD